MQEKDRKFQASAPFDIASAFRGIWKARAAFLRKISERQRIWRKGLPDVKNLLPYNNIIFHCVQAFLPENKKSGAPWVTPDKEVFNIRYGITQ